MSVNGIAEVVDDTVCCVCRADLAADHRIDTGDGRSFCSACYERSERLSTAEATPAGPEAKPTPAPFPPVTNSSPVNSTRRPSTPTTHSSHSVNLVRKVTCPHCWHRFAPEEILWVSRHAELIGDPVLGPDAASRFRPSRFNIDCHAIDARGLICHDMACPHCHLLVPHALIGAEPLFTSIIGVSASGKSYLLTAMTWELRRVLPQFFAVAFDDADTVSNFNLNQYEQTLFLQDDPDRLVKLEKTDIVGQSLYDQIHLGQQVINLPRPFLFSLRPSQRHPNGHAAQKLSRVMCLYDNAGEHFNPGEDTTATPVTNHLARSAALMFLYDPTQDPRFRARCRGMSADPQLGGSSPTRRQETILIEAAQRVRRYTGLTEHRKHGRPLLVIVPKADVWSPLIDLDLTTEPIVPGAACGGKLAAVDVKRIEDVSRRVRDLLVQTAPEFVQAAEEFCDHVVYIPVSALGGPPERQNNKEGFWVRPRQIAPQWVTVPVLYMFAKWSHGLIAAFRPEDAQASSAANVALPAADTARPAATT